MKMALTAMLVLGAGPVFCQIPQYDHVVVVMLENHSFQEIRGTADTNLASPIPYLNTTLVPGGTLMTAAYGLQHPSQPNYYWLFSGSNQGITTDVPPITANGTNTVSSSAPNLYTELQALPAPKTFVGYVEGYAGPSSLTQGTFTFNGTMASSGNATGELANVVRHMPWTGFSNVPESVSQSFSSSPFVTGNYTDLPDVAFVIPALQHDMHNYAFGAGAAVDSVAQSDIAMGNADAWLQESIGGYAQWALANNSLLIITTDEDSSADWLTPSVGLVNYAGPPDPHTEAQQAGTPGFTNLTLGPSATAGNPAGDAQSGPNQIFTLFYGANVQQNATYTGNITNVNVLRTIEAAMGISTTAGSQPGFAGNGVLVNDGAIAGAFVPEPGTFPLLLGSAAAAGLCALRRRASRSKPS